VGILICRTCDVDITGDGNHVCSQKAVLALVERLREETRTAEQRLSDIRNAVFRALEELPGREGELVAVPFDRLRQLWDAAQCRWYEATTADDFLARWLATHRILCEAFDVFRSVKCGKRETLLEKLLALRAACDAARATLGYENSGFDLTPEDLAAK
jgi:hypothetical protein